MATEPKPTPPATFAHGTRADVKGIRVFTYPKVIFMFPTLVVALICGIGMLTIGDKTEGQRRAEANANANAQTIDAAPASGGPAATGHDRFKKPENLFAVLFLGVFGFNLLIMAIDFPRFTIVAVGLLVGFLVFFILWIGAAFDVELMRAVRGIMSSIYLNANAEFYFLIATILAAVLLIVYVTRYLDYYQILPNEILHHHGPMSDLERFPTMNLKFDKEIPDVLEFAFLGAGRLVLHVTEERKAIVLDNVLFINSVEAALKNLMSRMEVRVTTDQEVAEMRPGFNRARRPPTIRPRAATTTIEQLRAFASAQPFRPFMIHLADGRTIPVAHREFIMAAPSGRPLSVSYQPDDTLNVIDLLLVADLEVKPVASGSGTRRKG